MPFTASHVMAVLPAMRRGLRLDPTCLAIGSMAPDFQYFLWARREGEFSHSLLGLVVFCLPLTLALATVWQRHVQWLMLELAPAAVARRCVPRAWPAVAVPMLVVSALLGTATHLLWDGFTHTNDVFTSRIDELGALYTVPLLGTIPLHRVLQHVSTLLGLVVVAGAAARAIARAVPRDDDPSARRWRARVLVAG
ncbi:MAG: DUF4184 family protein, partial [Proteobacteria bacterium]|nr:DUF4184 family protein [Pseudomonadota bacterium]